MAELNSREELLEAVQQIRRELDGIIAGLDEEQMERPGSFGEWSFKDMVAHLTGWRLVTAARLEAGLRNEEPEFPWPTRFDEANDLHEINRWFFETNRDKSVAEVLRESNETFDRVERAIATMPEDDLLQPGRFAWVHWTEDALGPAVVRGTQNHFYREHEPDIRAWLAQR